MVWLSRWLGSLADGATCEIKLDPVMWGRWTAAEQWSCNVVNGLAGNLAAAPRGKLTGRAQRPQLTAEGPDFLTMGGLLYQCALLSASNTQQAVY